MAAFRQGLTEAGFEDGRNVAIEFRWTEGQGSRLPALAADLAGQPVSVIVSSAGIVAARAAKTASASIPIVFVMGGYPVKFGLVARFKPGGNLTGVSFLLNVLAAKRVRLLDLSPLPVKDGREEVKSATPLRQIPPERPVVLTPRCGRRPRAPLARRRRLG
jgi:putative tryptophan/tyrosine transport system substrate-binding protein